VSGFPSGASKVRFGKAERICLSTKPRNRSVSAFEADDRRVAKSANAASAAAVQTKAARIPLFMAFHASK
jgi:hypothetical protein